MNAKQAREKALNSTNIKIYNQYQIVKREIKNEANNGNFKVTFFNKTLMIEVINLLKNEG